MSIYIALPIERDPSSLSDWMEINCLIDADGTISRQDLISHLKLEQEVEEDQIGQSESDNLLAQVFSEINRRALAAGSGYPFLMKGDLIKRKKGNEKFLPYIFCLLISYFGVQKTEYFFDWKTNITSKKFEELSASVIKSLIDNKKLKAHVRVFGYPRRWKGKNSNPQFIPALKKICYECGEMQAKDRLAAETANDAGLDIIAWKRFPDKLQGGILFWGQCATGNDWKDKLGDVEHFEFFIDNNNMQKIKGTFIPHSPDVSTERGAEDWLYHVLRAGMLFSRCRIAYLAEGWKDKWVKKLCSDSLKKIKAESVQDLNALLS